MAEVGEGMGGVWQREVRGMGGVWQREGVREGCSRGR